MPFSYSMEDLPVNGILDDYVNHNSSLSFLAKKYNLNRWTISKILSNNNISIRDKNTSHRKIVCNDPNLVLDKNEIKKLYIEEKKSLNQISRLIKCPVSTLYKFIKQNNIQLRKAGEGIKLSFYETHNKDTWKKSIEKRIINNIKKYGIKHNAQLHIPKETLNLIDNKDWLIEQNYTQKKTQNQIAKELNISQHCIESYFKKYKIKIKKWKNSKPEKEIYDYIKSIYSINIEENNRSSIFPYELDIYIPDKHLAIEFNGLYYHSYNHSETPQERNYHLIKTELCKEKGIQLLHVFENEWLNKQDIVKSIIASKLGIYQQQIGARECKISLVNFQDTRLFLEQNHIQGFTLSKINIGLYHQNELVSLMTFGKPRFNKHYEWEMIRYCNKLHTKISGGASKLLNYFKENYKPKSIISYADRRYFNGKLYEQLGFSLLRKSKPNYYYFLNNTFNLYSRVQFQKHKLKHILTIFNSNLTESENMFNNKYRRIWDCGNLVYILIK